ncbi:zinc finger protein 425-like, partial [Spodoptera litura]|uniref:Zinc finger protein 425-like n=1 Tax=Spodoptera litura TaxID=69820 RepID=A0A9J7ETC6_SPOLT
MDSEENGLCCGCLSTGRKMILQVEYWKKLTFSQIINEFTLSHGDSTPVWLCWECDANLHQFTKFKNKVKTSYVMFLDFVKQNSKLSQFQPRPRLTQHVLYNFDLYNTDHKPFQIIPTHNSEMPIKEELSDIVEDNNSDDEKLIVYKTYNKQKNVKLKRKRRKRNVDRDRDVELFKEVELSAEELLEERRVLLLREEYVNAMFKCEKCILSFPNAEDLKDHLYVKHELNKSNYKCDVCECSFASEVSYNYHTNKHIRRYECSVCMERCVSKRAVAKHYESTHCHGPSIDIDVRNNHIELVTQDHRTVVDTPNEQNGLPKDTAEGIDDSTNTPILFACDSCSKSFKWKASLRKHMEIHRIETGQKRKPYCEPCKLSFTNTANLQKHVRTSSNHQIQLKLRKLTEVLPDSSNPEKRQQHIDQHIEQIKCSVKKSRQQYPCPQCDKKFQWRGNLLRHVHSHVA